MFKVISETDTIKEKHIKPKRGVVSTILKSFGTHPFGLFDFIIVLFSYPMWVFFTGLAICLGLEIPDRWFDVVNGPNYRNVNKPLRDKLKSTSFGKVRVEDIKPRDISPIS